MTPLVQTQLLHGRISNLRRSRRSQDFFFTDADHAKMGATAIAAGLVGLGSIATGLAGMATDTKEEADLLEFDLDGKPIKAWVWSSVFKEGDVLSDWAIHGKPLESADSPIRSWPFILTAVEGGMHIIRTPLDGGSYLAAS